MASRLKPTKTKQSTYMLQIDQQIHCWPLLPFLLIQFSAFCVHAVNLMSFSLLPPVFTTSLEKRNEELQVEVVRLKTNLAQQRHWYQVVQAKIVESERTRASAELRNGTLQREMEQFFDTFGELNNEAKKTECIVKSFWDKNVWIVCNEMNSVCKAKDKRHKTGWSLNCS